MFIIERQTPGDVQNILFIDFVKEEEVGAWLVVAWRGWCRHINGFRVGVFPVGGRQLG